MNNDFFINAKPVWAKDLEKEKNITLGFYKKISYQKGEAVLKIACSGFYKVFLNGSFLYFGPARCAHGYYRVDEINFPLKKGENHVAIEAVGYYVNSFYALLQSSFTEAELTIDGTVSAATGTDDSNCFKLYRLNERVRKVQRYSYQRAFAEAYTLDTNYCEWRIGKSGSNAVEQETVIVKEKRLLTRNIPLNKFPKVYPDCKVGSGLIKTGIIPEHYIKDRSLVNIKNPDCGNLEGYPETELEVHLSDEVQEMQTVMLNSEKTAYSGKTLLKSKEFEILSFPCEKTGFINAEINCISYGVLYLLFDEILNDKGDVNPLRLDCCNVIKIAFKKGHYSFMSAEPVGFKYIKLLCTDGEFEINGLSVTETVCPVPITFDYKSNDDKLNSVISAARETFIQNSFDLFTDCPTRERAGWLCDSFFLGRAEKIFTGKNLIEENFLENYLLPEKFDNIPYGMLPMCYPADVDNGEFIPNWAMWFVLELKDYNDRNKDSVFILRFKPMVYRLLSWLEKHENADGLLECLPGWVFIEWSKANDFVQDINFPSNMLYSAVLCAAGELFGDEASKQKAEKLKATVRTRSFDGEFFVDNEVYEDGKPISTGNRTETCQYYAFFTGIATKEEYRELWEKLIKDFGPDRAKTGAFPEIYPSNAFIGNFLRLEILCANGCYAQVLEEIKGYFFYMAELTGTLWEHISTSASCNHGFASYAASLIHKAEQNLKLSKN